MATLKIRPEWDAALTYDDLSAPTSGAIFVGREDLLDVIVGVIRQPDRRGTFLVSGYRGAGKTTLLIEAIRRVGRGNLLPEGWQLLPLVLNASEVSAALPVTAGAVPGGTPLQIGPQQLLTALIRTLRNYAQSPNALLQDDLKTDILETYRKAMAKEYSWSEGGLRQRTQTLTRDVELKFTTADVYKSLSVAGAAAAVVIEGSAWLPTAWGATLHALAVAAGALTVASWTASQKLSNVAKEESTQAVSVKFDNSLQQLEADLKELLLRLHRQQRRVVVVLEELDKLRDEDGQQLDAVIRYFKNLFTQAPALFFFVTDKDYYDFIAREIRRARRERSYAIQHTFFTHRLFVGRPTTRDCLNYLKRILIDEAAGQQLDTLYAPGGIEPFSHTIANDPLLRLTRSLLFKASNHLFDLKNELRRFVRTDGADLVIDPGALSEDDMAAGIFQDLIVQKYGLFAFGDGRPYVNEVLNDCLHAVFSDLGSDAVQLVNAYYPRARAALGGPAAAPPTSPATIAGTAPPTPPATTAAAAPAKVVEDQLELSEELRIRAAVDSLIEDLQRGGAFEADGTSITHGQFVWKRTAARAFRFLRRLERHETALIERLEKLRSAVAVFATGGTLGDLVGVQADADTFLQEIGNAKKEVETTSSTLSVDETDKRSLNWQRRATEPIAKAYGKHLERLADRYGLTFEPIGSSVEGGTLLLLRGSFGDARQQKGGLGAAVLLAQGEGGRLDDDAREFVGRAPGLRRLAVLHVLHGVGDTAALAAREEQWRRQLADAIQQPTPNREACGLVVQALALDEGWPAEALAQSWGDRLAEHTLLHAAWANLPVEVQGRGTDVGSITARPDAQTWASAGGTPQSEHPSFVRTLADWLKGEQRILFVYGGAQLKASLADMCLAALARIDAPEIVSHVWTRTTDAADPVEVLAGYILGAAGGKQDKDARVPGIVTRLIAQRQLIPIITPSGSPEASAKVESPSEPPKVSWSDMARLIGTQGRAIVTAPETWIVDLPSEVTKSTLSIEPLVSQAA